jgi:hypothetical protein
MARDDWCITFLHSKVEHRPREWLSPSSTGVQRRAARTLDGPRRSTRKRYLTTVLVTEDGQVAVISFAALHASIRNGKHVMLVAELRIADDLAQGPRTVGDSARECGVLERPLRRPLRALTGEGIFAEQGDRRFMLTSMAQLLRSDSDKSPCDWATLMADLPYQAFGGSAAQPEDRGRRRQGAGGAELALSYWGALLTM